MQFNTIALAILPALALAAPAATTTSSSISGTSTQTSQLPDASCVYKKVSSGTAYFARLPKANLNAQTITEAFDHGESDCKVSDSKIFTEEIKLTQVWQAGEVYPSCKPVSFAKVVAKAMGNDKAVTCTEFKGPSGSALDYFGNDANYYFNKYN